MENEAAETGIGTLIVFIAMILVAAVAAGVLIQTAGSLQEQARSTGESATSRVATALDTVGVFGERAGTTTLSADIRNITINIQLASGSPAMDLRELRIRLSDGSHAPREMSYTDATATNSTFTAASLRDSDSSFSASNPTVTKNDLVKITITNVYLDPRSSVNIHLIPEGGTTALLAFTTPTTYGGDKYITLA